MATSAAGQVKRVVILVQENHTVDNYFRGLALYGAAVATDWPLSPNPPARDQRHDRHAYFNWLAAAGTATRLQFDTAAVLPYYLYLAATGAFLENHCSEFGTNSTPNHLAIVGGQSPTLRIPRGVRCHRSGTCRRCPVSLRTTASPGGCTRPRRTTRSPSTAS